MWALIADNLLTGLPSPVRPTGSFSKSKAYKAYITSFYTNNKLPSSPAAIYLPLNSCHLSFLTIVFSCLLTWPMLSLERCMWISGSLLFYLFIFFPLPTCHDPMIGPWSSLWSFPAPPKHLGQHQSPHITGGGRVQLEAKAIRASPTHHPTLSPPLNPLLQGPCFCTALLKEKSSKQGGKRRQRLFLRLCPSCVMAALGFHVLSGWVSPAPAVSVSSLKICVPQRQETFSPLHPFQLSSV